MVIKEYRLVNERVKENAINSIRALQVDSENPLRLIIDEDKRSNAQNRKMWAVLSDIADQVVWMNEKLKPEEWKHLITANLHGQKCVKGINGGLVFMGLSTKKMSKMEFADVITCAEQFGAENGVQFSDEALQAIKLAQQYKEQLARAS